MQTPFLQILFVFYIANSPAEAAGIPQHTFSRRFKNEFFAIHFARFIFNPAVNVRAVNLRRNGKRTYEKNAPAADNHNQAKKQPARRAVRKKSDFVVFGDCVAYVKSRIVLRKHFDEFFKSRNGINGVRRNHFLKKATKTRAATPQAAPTIPAALEVLLPNCTVLDVSVNRLDEFDAELDELGVIPPPPLNGNIISKPLSKQRAGQHRRRQWRRFLQRRSLQKSP